MKKYIPNGAVIKERRQHLERCSTQKEMAHEIGVSERKLRQIENANEAITFHTLDRLAKALGAHRDQILMSSDPNAGAANIVPGVVDWDIERLIPRHDYAYAQATSDEGKIYLEASRSHDISCIIQTSINDETSGYVEELILILSALSYANRSILDSIPPVEEIAKRRRIKQLLVLLKGNDVWVFAESHSRKLPERYSVAVEGDASQHEQRLVVAFGPPGEYGEDNLKIPIDNGQPYILPAWSTLKAQLTKQNEGSS